MSIKRYFRIRHLYHLIKNLLLDKQVIVNHKLYNEKTLLLIKTEAIGDYILFRNFIEQVKKSERFAGYRIILVGNELWKEMALAYDSPYVDDFIWINRNAFVSDFNYRKQLLKQVNDLNVEYAIQANYSREFLIGDALVNASQARYRIGSKGDRLNEWTIFKNLADEWFTSLLSVNDEVLFEFDKNKIFFEAILGAEIKLPLPSIPVTNKQSVNEIICFPGAGEAIKQWPIQKFAALLGQLYAAHQLPIRICGSGKEFELGEQLKCALPNAVVLNDCGKTSLSELCQAIASAKLLITNDSSAFHIAAAVSTPVLCVLMGRHYGRFAPYPKAANWVQTIYPDAFIAQLNNKQLDANATDFDAVVSIDEIAVDTVFEQANSILQQA
jgi:ADP-heptose:LPS heptosyltransferase